jgi:hypothetical protein
MGEPPLFSGIRSFTDEGLNRFRSWLDAAETAEPKRHSTTPPPTDLLFDDRFSRPVGYGGKVRQIFFERKFDLGMEVCRALGNDVLRLMPDANAWAWLSLFFHESTIRTKKGRWFTGDRSRHLVQTIEGRKQDQSHRHLVKGAVTNISRIKEYAVVLMSGSDGQSKIEEQVMSRRGDQPLAFHREFVRTLYELYWDIDADDLKSGARSEGPGSVMHLIDLLTQFDLTYDISSLEAGDFLALLPKAFNRFRPLEERKSRRHSRPEEDRAGPPLPA